MRSPAPWAGAEPAGSRGNADARPAPQGQQGQQGQRGQAGAGDSQQRLQFLEGLPSDFSGRVKALNNYEFFDPAAQQAFDELLNMLKQQAMGNMFREMAQRMANMTPEEMQRSGDAMT